MSTVVTNTVGSDTSILWLIVLIPVVLSLVLYFLAKCLIAFRPPLEEEEEEEESRLYEETTCHYQDYPHTPNPAPPSPPPSYFASHRDRLYRIHEKPPDYVITITTTATTTTTTIDPEDMPLDKVKQIIMDKRQN